MLRVWLARWLLLPPIRRGARFLAALWHGLYIPAAWRTLRAWRPSAPVAAALLSLLITLQTLRFSAITADWRVAVGFLGQPMLFLLNWAPIAGVLALAYLLVGRLYIAYAVTALPVLGLALVNYYKLLLRGDPLLFADIALVSEAKAISAHYTIRPAPGVLLALLVTLALTVALQRGYRAQARPGMPLRLAGCAVCVAALFGYGRLALPNDALYGQTGLSVPWMPTQSYVAHGVVYPFLRSATSLTAAPPDGYDEQMAAANLNRFADADIPDEQKVDIIAIMMEAFGDFSTVPGLTFENDPYADLHALMAESYAGQLVANVFAGETVNTERAFLTGYLDPTENFRAPVSSFVWYLKGQGYRTQGSHPGNNWFYNRLNVDQYLGFERYYFYEDRYRWYIKGAQILPDAQFFPTILADHNLAAVGGKPVFSFHVTYQNHGPYPTTAAYDRVYLPWQAGVDEANFNIANNYFTGLAETGRQLRALAEKLRGSERPVVLVAFGDHKPWWGDGNSTYKAFGINLDRTTEEGFYNYFTTPYLIWANDAAKAALGNDFVGDGGRVGASFLMERLFTLAGWEGPKYMQALREVGEHTPFVNRERWLDGDGLSAAGRSEEPGWLKRFRQVEYYEKNRFGGKGLASQ